MSELEPTRKAKLDRIHQDEKTLQHTFSDPRIITAEYKKKDGTYHKADVYVYMNNNTGVHYIPAANILDTYLGVKADMSAILEEFNYPDIMYTMASNKYRNVAKSHTFQIYMSCTAFKKYIESTDNYRRKTDKQILYDILVKEFPFLEPVQEQEETQEHEQPIQDTIPVQSVETKDEQQEEKIQSVQSSEPKNIFEQLQDMVSEKDARIKSQSEQIENYISIIEEQKKTIENLQQNQSVFTFMAESKLGEAWDCDDHSSAAVFDGIDTFWMNANGQRLLTDIRGMVTTFVSTINAVHNTNNQGVTYNNIYILMGLKLNGDFYTMHDDYNKAEGKSYSYIEFAVHDIIHACHLMFATYEYAQKQGLLYFLYQTICRRYNVPTKSVNFAIHFIHNIGVLMKTRIPTTYINTKTDLEYIKKHKKV